MRDGILALDIATKSGWAFKKPNHKAVYSSFVVVKEYYGEGEALLQFAKFMSDTMKLHKPKYLYIEAPFLRNFKNSKGQNVTQNMNVAKVLLRLTGIAHLYGASSGLASQNIHEINNQDVKQFMTGTRHASKKNMIDATEAKGYTPKCDNEADALGVLHVAWSKEYKQEMPFD